MKRNSKWLVACAGACLVSVTAFGSIEFGLSASENDYNTLLSDWSPGTSTVGTSTVGYSQQFSDSRELIGATVRDPQGQKLGTIHEVVLSPRNGEAFAAVNVGLRTYALVPIQALSVTPATGMFRKSEVTLNCTRENLENGPTIRNGDWQQLDSPTFTQSIYGHFQMQPPAAVGGVGSSMGGTSKGTEQSPK